LKLILSLFHFILKLAGPQYSTYTEEGIDGNGWKDIEKRKVLRREWKTSVPGSKYDDEEKVSK